MTSTSSESSSWSRTSQKSALLILAASLLIKLFFIAYLDQRVYRDVIRAVTFGYAVDHQILSVNRDFVRTKTFIGPVLWYHVFDRFGVPGLQTINLLLFVCLIWIHFRTGRIAFGERVVLVALFLFAFYPGTNRNVIAGETDDNLATLFFAAGILVYLSAKTTGASGWRLGASSLLMGIGFLFKFWIGIFCFGFVIYLLSRKMWKETPLVIAGMITPFLMVNFVSGFTSLQSVLTSLQLQRGYSGWKGVEFKLLSTGMIFAAIVSAIVWWKNRTNVHSLLFFVSVMYMIYAIIQIDAFAASYVMMCCLFFSSFLIAEWLLTFKKQWVIVALVSYFLICGGITYHRLYEDTNPLFITTHPEEVRKMFP